MQKEDLIKRLRLFAVITTTLFVVLVVSLLVQFGFIAYYHSEMKNLQDRNAEIQQKADDLAKELAYYGENGAGLGDGV